MWKFTPEKLNTEIQVVFIEDARADFAPYYATRQSLREAEARVATEMGKLNASVTAFERGLFHVGVQDRHGYLIRFLFNGAPGLIRVAGLPIRTHTAKKEGQVRIQCLMNVADWLKAAVTVQVFSPDTQPLLPYLLVDGEHTVADYIFTKGRLPELASGSDSNIVEARVELL